MPYCHYKHIKNWDKHIKNWDVDICTGESIDQNNPLTSETTLSQIKARDREGDKYV